MAGPSVALLLSLAAAMLVPGQGQFLRGFVHSYSSSSFMSSSRTGGDGRMHQEEKRSSSSWVPGSDGRMHQETHEMHSETVRNIEGDAVKRTQSEVACADGRCQQTVSVVRPGSVTVMQAGSPFGATSRLRTSVVNLRAFLRGLVGPRHAEQAPKPLLVTVAMPSPQLNKAAQPLPLEDTLAPLVAIAAGALLSSFTAVALLMKCRGSASAESARELPLRNLAEPLAPIEEEMAVAGAAALPPQVGVAAAAKEGLARIYARASAAALEAEARAAAAYVARVYARAATAA